MVEIDDALPVRQPQQVGELQRQRQPFLAGQPPACALPVRAHQVEEILRARQVLERQIGTPALLGVIGQGAAKAQHVLMV